MKTLLSHESQVDNFAQHLKLRLKKGNLLCVDVKKADKATAEQFGFLHSTVLPIYTEAMFNAGYIKHKTQEHAKYYLKRKIGYGAFYEFNDGVVFQSYSFGKAKIDTLTLAIDKAIEDCEQLGYFVPMAK